MHEFHIHLDMDGPLADYDRAARERGVPLRSLKDIPGIFRELPVMEGAIEAVATLQRIAPGAVRILSTPPKARFKEACEEKRDWIAKHFPSIPPQFVGLVLDKGAVGTPHDLLVDDHPDWNGADQFPGTVIHYTGPESWEKVIRWVEKQNAS